MELTKEIILSIEEIEYMENLWKTHKDPHHNNYRYEGYKIVTDKQVIYLLIDSDQQCSEHWGYISSEDTFSKFIGAELKDISIIDEELMTKKLDKQMKKDLGADSMYDGDAIFINLDTNNGKLQFALYNEHNGYYGHNVKVISNQIKRYNNEHRMSKKKELETKRFHLNYMKKHLEDMNKINDFDFAHELTLESIKGYIQTLEEEIKELEKEE